jgi:hypothetical protein
MYLASRGKIITVKYNRTALFKPSGKMLSYSTGCSLGKESKRCELVRYQQPLGEVEAASLNAEAGSGERRGHCAVNTRAVSAEKR